MQYKQFALIDEYIQAMQDKLHPLDWLMLTSVVGDVDVLEVMRQSDRPERFAFCRRLFMQFALGGVTCAAVRAAYDAGNLGVYGLSDQAWAKDLPGIEDLDPDGGVLLLGEPGGPIIEAFVNAGGQAYALGAMYEEHLGEIAPTPHDLRDFLVNCGGRVEKQVIVGTTKNIPWKLWKGVDGNWYTQWGEQPAAALRPFYALNGMPCVDGQLLPILSLGYIFGAFDEIDMRGRIAYSKHLWVEPVFVGWDTPLYAAFRKNKVSLIGVSLNAGRAGWGITLTESAGDMLAVAERYEELGVSIFMQKSGKYIVADAGMVGFTKHPDGSVSVAWKADKLAKLTGRALFCVPTFREYVSDGKGGQVGDTPKPRTLRMRRDV